MTDLRFDLLGNALDSLAHGVRFVILSAPSRSDLKLAVMLTAQGVELCLKERLRQHDPNLIFVDPTKTGDDDLTINISECIKRLKQDAGVAIPRRHKKTIERLSKIRNRLQHYQIDIPFDEAVNRVHTAIAFLTDFLNTELHTDIKDHLSRDDIQGLIEIEQIVEQLKRVAFTKISDLENANAPWNLSDRAAWHFEVQLCPDCWQEFYVFSPDSRISQCQLCHYEGGFVTCDRCGFQAPAGSMDFEFEGDGMKLCNACWADIQAQ